MKVIFESQATRTYTGDPMKFFGVNPIPNGSFVSVGYLIPPKDARGGSDPKDVFTGGRLSRKYNIPSNDEILQSYIQRYAGTAFAIKMEEIRQSPKYQAALKAGDDNKIVPFDLGNCHIIKIGRYNINWRNEGKNAENWAERTEDLWALRKKYGFGKDESEYSETDWRRKEKYQGTGIMPKRGKQVIDDPDDPDYEETEYLDSAEISRRNALAKWKSSKEGVASYQPTGWGLYTGHEKQAGRLAIRQQVAQVRPGASRWYFVDEEGEMTELSRECVNWMCSAYKQVKAPKEVEAMEADEQAYVNELNALEALDDAQVKQLLLDRVLYIVGATKLPDGTREPISYVNDVAIYDEYPYLDPDAMNAILSQWVKISTKDVMELNEAVATGKFKDAALNEAVKAKVRRALNESESDGTSEKYTNLLDFIIKEGKMNPNMDFDKCMDKVKLIVTNWGKKNGWEDDEVNEVMKYLFSPKFSVKKTPKGYECSLKAHSKTISWSI